MLCLSLVATFAMETKQLLKCCITPESLLSLFNAVVQTECERNPEMVTGCRPCMLCEAAVLMASVRLYSLESGVTCCEWVLWWIVEVILTLTWPWEIFSYFYDKKIAYQLKITCQTPVLRYPVMYRSRFDLGQRPWEKVSDLERRSTTLMTLRTAALCCNETFQLLLFYREPLRCYWQAQYAALATRYSPVNHWLS